MTTPKQKRAPARKTATLPPATADDRSSQAVAPRDAIAQLAYQLFLERGGGHGHDVDDWVEAERRIVFDRMPT
jgi:hypothetical protein